MFTGLVEEVGTVRSISRSGFYQKMVIEADQVFDDLKRGDSVSVNGVCQTVTELTEHTFSMDTLAVSLQKTTLGELKSGDEVNLERAVKPDTRMGGHMVQGHVDGVGAVTGIRKQAQNIYMEVRIPEKLARYCVDEGSIAVDGISLTIAGIRGVNVQLNIIPVTWNDSVLRNRKIGDHVNIEVDMIARYAEKLLKHIT